MKPITKAFKCAKDIIVHGRTIDKYEDALNVYQSFLKGIKHCPNTRQSEKIDINSDEGKAFIRQAKEKLEIADKAIDEVLSPQ